MEKKNPRNISNLLFSRQLASQDLSIFQSFESASIGESVRLVGRILLNMFLWN